MILDRFSLKTKHLLLFMYKTEEANVETPSAKTKKTISKVVHLSKWPFGPALGRGPACVRAFHSIM